MNKMATQQRLIDANELENHRFPTQESLYNSGWNDAIDAIMENAPTVDAVEVVRCRDCKHYMTIHCTCDGCCISDDWYCADGERRTGHV